jgi:hypothetical protein
MNLKETILEAIDTGDYPDFINPSRKEAIASGQEEITGVLPDIGGSAASYLEIITSKNYNKLMQRLEYYSGVSAKNQSLPSLISQLFTGVQKIQRLENKNKKFLESLSLDLILSLPEFKQIKELHDSGDLLFDVQLGPAELQNVITQAEKEAEEKNAEAPEENELNEGESEEMALIKELQSEEKAETILRRRLANTIMQGIATHGLFLFNLVEDKLNELDKNLIPLYGMVSVLTQLGYFAVPANLNLGGMSQDAQAGSEEVIENEGTYTIKARGLTFPFLVHEIVKGIYEYMALEGATPNDTLEAEIPDIIYGPEFYNLLTQFIPDDKRELIPLVYKKFLEIDLDEIKEVLAGGGKAKAIIDRLVNLADEEMQDYEKYED